MVSIVEPFEQKQQRQVVIVTGLSGAGKTSVMRALEDFGFYCVDNLPTPLLTTFLNFAFTTPTNLLKVAVGIDARSQRFFKNFMEDVEHLKGDMGLDVKVIFLTSSDSVIIKRFQETRRKHPLGRGASIRQAIEKEKVLLEPICAAADVVLDTDTFNIHELRKWVHRTYAKEEQEMVVNLISFGFKYGLPPESSLVYDLCFLPNPYFVPDLRPLDGRDERIATFLFGLAEVQEYWEHVQTFLKYSLTCSYKEGRFVVNVAFGCTGGRHRSVAFVERLAQCSWKNMMFMVHHRDVTKEGK